MKKLTVRNSTKPVSNYVKLDIFFLMDNVPFFKSLKKFNLHIYEENKLEKACKGRNFKYNLSLKALGN